MTEFERAVAARRAPGALFTPEAPVHIARSPGRLDLMGGNVDYTGGMVFESTIREATWAAAQRRRDSRIVLSNPQMKERGWREEVSFDLADLSSDANVRALVNASPEVRWTAYVLGVFHLLKRRHPDMVTVGASVYIESDVPLNKGVSSSAAVEVSVMKSAAAAYGIDLGGIELAEACQWVENVIAESACGIMDQATAVLGDEGYVLPILCQPCRVLPMVKLPPSLTCSAVDSGASHEVSGIEYEAARAAAFMGYKLITMWEQLPVTLDERGAIPRYVEPRWNGYLSNMLPSEYRARFEWRLPEIMTGPGFLGQAESHIDPFTQLREGVVYRIRNCTRYAVEENARIETFAELARGASIEVSEAAFRLMGDLMYQSHWSYTECGLGSKACDMLVDLVREEGAANGLYGAKITGGGAGGTVAILGRADARDAFRRVVTRFGERRGFEPYVFEGSSMGADRFGVRVMEPAA
jgi:L-arabinokinase